MVQTKVRVDLVCVIVVADPLSLMPRARPYSLEVSANNRRILKMRLLNQTELTSVGGGVAILSAVNVLLAVYAVATIGREFMQGFRDGLEDGAS